MNALEATTIVGAVSAGVTGGMLFVFSNAVMGALGRLPAAAAIRTMQAINELVINPLFLTALFAPALLGLGVGLGGGHPATLIGGALYAVGVVGVTMLGNVPLNNRLARHDPDAPDAAALWQAYARPWLRFNHLRSAVAVLASAVLMIGVA